MMYELELSATGFTEQDEATFGELYLGVQVHIDELEMSVGSEE